MFSRIILWVFLKYYTALFVHENRSRSHKHDLWYIIIIWCSFVGTVRPIVQPKALGNHRAYHDDCRLSLQAEFQKWIPDISQHHYTMLRLWWTFIIMSLSRCVPTDSIHMLYPESRNQITYLWSRPVSPSNCLSKTKSTTHSSQPYLKNTSHHSHTYTLGFRFEVVQRSKPNC